MVIIKTRHGVFSAEQQGANKYRIIDIAHTTGPSEAHQNMTPQERELVESRPKAGDIIDASHILEFLK